MTAPADKCPEDHPSAAGDAETPMTRFVRGGDPAAFAAIVREYGPMVYGVCRRSLGNAHDADDAFQAVFLVLARKAAGLKLRQPLGAWLHGVALRTAQHARRGILRRKKREAAAAQQQAQRQGSSAMEAHERLDVEIARLPDALRVPLVMHYLEGREKLEIARLQGLPEGTISSRLARAREKLRRRLAAQGDPLAAPATLVAAVPVLLMHNTFQLAGGATAGAVGATAGASVLAKGVLHAMLIKKLVTIGAAVLAVAVLGGAGGLAVQHVLAKDKPSAAEAGAVPAGKEAAAASDNVHGTVLRITGNTLTLSVSGMKDKQKTTSEMELVVAPDADIEFVPDVKNEKKPAKLEDLTAGTPVAVTVGADPATVKSITILGTTVNGSVTAVADGKLTVTTKTKDGPEEKTYTITDATRIITGHGPNKGDVQEGKVTDLVAGARVVLHLSASDKTLVKSIDVQPAAPAKGK